VPLRAGSESSSGLAEHALLTALRARLGTSQGGAGLRQFKSAFAPRWERLYLAAPNRLALALAAVDIARRIARPRRLPSLGAEHNAAGDSTPKADTAPLAQRKAS